MPSTKKSEGARRWWASLSPEQKEEQLRKRSEGYAAAIRRRQEEDRLHAGLPYEHCTEEQLRDHILRLSGKAGEELARRGATLIVAWRGWAVGLPSPQRSHK